MEGSAEHGKKKMEMPERDTQEAPGAYPCIHAHPCTRGQRAQAPARAWTAGRLVGICKARGVNGQTEESRRQAHSRNALKYRRYRLRLGNLRKQAPCAHSGHPCRGACRRACLEG